MIRSNFWRTFLFLGLRQDSGFDHFSRLLSLLGLSFPIFSIAPFLIFIFAISLGWLPVSEWGDLKHYVLPCLTLIIPLTCIITRVTRNRCLEEKESTWITVLLAKGLSSLQINLRLFKACLPTILHTSSLQLSVVLAGTMVTESIFDIPGMGSLLLESIQNRDYPLVQGIVAYSTIIYVIIFFLTDYLVYYVDPRQAQKV